MALGELKNGIGPDAYAIYQQVLAAVVERDHPVGSLYISENPTSPAELYGGTWERIEDRFIMGASDTHSAGTTVEAGLPSIYGQINGVLFSSNQPTTGGIFSVTLADGWILTKGSTSGNVSIYVNNVKAVGSSIYGKSTTVQPPAYCTYIWRRVA